MQVATLTGNCQDSGGGVNGFWYRLDINSNEVLLAWDIQFTSGSPTTAFTLPLLMQPFQQVRIGSDWLTGTGPASFNPFFSPGWVIQTNGHVAPSGIFVNGLIVYGTARVPLLFEAQQ